MGHRASGVTLLKIDLARQQRPRHVLEEETLVLAWLSRGPDVLTEKPFLHPADDFRLDSKGI